MTSSSVIALVGVSKRFGDLTVLDDLDLEVRRGEFLTLLGESGCGKTTTLRIISGFEAPTTGTVYLNGSPVNHLPAYRRRVNTVFQNYALFPHLRVGENVEYGLRFDGVPRRQRRRLAEDMLARVGLADKIDQYPDALSGGQMQRVALARALIKNPEVLLLDEPLSALDAKLRKELQLELKRTQRETGITFIYVTHDQEEALVMSDRIAVMESGRIRQLGRPNDIFERPQTLFVAEFVGASNKLDGRVSAVQRDSVTVELPNGNLVEAPCPPGASLAAGDMVRLIIRPEHLRIAELGAGPAGTVRAVLQDVVYLGVDRKLMLDLGHGLRLELQERGDRLPTCLTTRIGQAITVEIPPAAVHVFRTGPAA